MRSCDGFVDFTKSDGKELGKRLKKVLDLIELQPGKTALDIGCGRGEFVCFLARNNIKSVGIDYAKEAIKLCDETKRKTKTKLASFKEMSCTKMSFKDESFDYIFSSDVVEHLYPHELDETTKECFRTLKKGGVLAIHTMPNAFVAKPGYWLIQHMGQKRGPMNQHMHVNEQTVFSLSKHLKDAGFTDIQTRLELNGNWFRCAEAYPKIKGWAEPFVKLMETGPVQFLAEKTPVGAIIATDIFMVAKKPL